MGLFDKFKGLFGGGAGDDSASGRLYLIDGVTVLGVRPGSRPSPREMLSLLYRLARFAEAEKIRVAVLFEGEPLHKASDGDVYNGVTVYYARDAAERPERLLALLKPQLRRGQATVIGADAALEKKIQALGADVLRATTFRKALDNAGLPEGGEGGPRGGGDRGGERGPRPDRGGERGERGGRRRRGGRRGGRGPRPERGGETGGGQAPESSSGGEAPRGGGSDAAVRNLLDVVE